MTAAARPTYTAVCYRADGWWNIDVPEVPGVHTQARRLDGVEALARDVIALMLGSPTDSFDLDIRPELSDEAIEAIENLGKASDAAAAAQATLVAARATAAQALVEGMGLTVRDAGRILGTSFQRINQLVRR